MTLLNKLLEKKSNKAQFFAYKEEIEEALKNAFNVKEIREAIIENDENFSIPYPSFIRYINIYIKNKSKKSKKVKNNTALKNSKTVKKSKGFKQNPKAFEEPKEKKQEMASAFSNYKKEDLI